MSKRPAYNTLSQTKGPNITFPIPSYMENVRPSNVSLSFRTQGKALDRKNADGINNTIVVILKVPSTTYVYTTVLSAISSISP